jgi:hypothetical protein
MQTSDLMHISKYLNTHKTVDCYWSCLQLCTITPYAKKFTHFCFNEIPITYLFPFQLALLHEIDLTCHSSNKLKSSTDMNIYTLLHSGEYYTLWNKYELYIYIPNWNTQQTHSNTYNTAPIVSPTSSITTYLCNMVNRHDFLSYYTTAIHHFSELNCQY